MEIVTTMLTAAIGQNIAGMITITISTMQINVLNNNVNTDNNNKNNKSATCFTLNTAPQPRLCDNIERARVDHGLRLRWCLRIAAANKDLHFMIQGRRCDVCVSASKQFARVFVSKKIVCACIKTICIRLSPNNW